MDVESGEPADPIAGLRTDPETLNAVLADPSLLESGDPTAVSVHISGDREAMHRLRGVGAPAVRSD